MHPKTVTAMQTSSKDSIILKGVYDLSSSFPCFPVTTLSCLRVCPSKQMFMQNKKRRLNTKSCKATPSTNCDPFGMRRKELSLSPRKNKMKPTNPNADTNVEKQRFNTYLSQFPANPLVEHPDLTHRGDTLVGHPCLTLLRYALVRHSCLTLWFDTLVGHSCLTLFWDSYLTLLWHILPWLTLFSDTLTWRSCTTLLRDTLVKDTLVRHSYLTFLLDTSSLTLL